MAVLLSLLLLSQTPALAGPEKGSKGKQSSQGGGKTEDTDSNDSGTPNNVRDDGDNRHPSGSDRSTEHGGSGNQGNSDADPDDDGRGPDRTNGGPDEADGSGGFDQADQDRNNGCGNDDDFEDSNEGHCSRATESGSQTRATRGSRNAGPRGGDEVGSERTKNCRRNVPANIPEAQGKPPCDGDQPAPGQGPGGPPAGGPGTPGGGDGPGEVGGGGVPGPGKPGDADRPGGVGEGRQPAGPDERAKGAKAGRVRRAADNADVLGLRVGANGAPAAAGPGIAAASQAARARGGTLPFTGIGAGLMLFVLLAAGLIAAGASGVAAGRGRRHHPSE